MEKGDGEHALGFGATVAFHVVAVVTSQDFGRQRTRNCHR